MKYKIIRADGAIEYRIDESTVLPTGAIELTDAEYAAGIQMPVRPLTQQEQFNLIERAIEMKMDEVAQAKGYDDRNSCRLYSGFSNPYQTEAIKFGQWVANCWALTFQAQAEIIAGTRTMPTIAEAVAMMPAMIW